MKSKFKLFVAISCCGIALLLYDSVRHERPAESLSVIAQQFHVQWQTDDFKLNQTHHYYSILFPSKKTYVMFGIYPNNDKVYMQVCKSTKGYDILKFNNKYWNSVDKVINTIYHELPLTIKLKKDFSVNVPVMIATASLVNQGVYVKVLYIDTNDVDGELTDKNPTISKIIQFLDRTLILNE
ncbi:hypothetical protein [Dielma fastidiosa]|uniref:hypothetical protein n=1 Tax=Dielma fastidiosa TaxID=1034346 RepID=UPI003565786D